MKTGAIVGAQHPMPAREIALAFNRLASTQSNLRHGSQPILSGGKAVGVEKASKGDEMNFGDWLQNTPGGRHCTAIMAGFGCEAGPALLELAFVAGQIDQAEKDRALIREQCVPGPAAGGPSAGPPRLPADCQSNDSDWPGARKDGATPAQMG